MDVQIMTFYFDYLNTEKFAKECDNLLFVGGAMTFLLRQLAGQLCINAHGATNVCLCHRLYNICVSIQGQMIYQALWLQ